MSALGRPGRVLTPQDRVLWDLLAGTRRLHLPRCEPHGHRWYPPAPCCPECLTDRFDWAAVAGTGSVVSWTTFHRPYLAHFDPPWTVVVAELAEGPLLVADLDGTPDDAARLALGAAVELTYRDAAFDDGGEGVTFSWRLPAAAADPSPTGDPS
ncbi:MAG: Zn-ribbon domain-containing OB-fold protein [Acidimicrobiia bacterium]